MKIAVVGSGVSGLVAAHLLSPRHDVVLFVADGAGSTAVDTGFIVFNRRTYPNFVRLLERLGVAAQESEMSFGVRSERRDLEYSGSGLLGLYAQPGNIFSPRFHRMVADVFRFFREAHELLGEGPEVELSPWLEAHGYSQAFIEDHFLPMVGAVWSSAREGVKSFPARFLARFFENHGFLQVNDRPTWLTVQGGSRTYVKAILDGFQGEVRTACPVLSLRRERREVLVRSPGSSVERYDHVILACHADQALRLLEDPSPAEVELLSAFPYRKNDVLLHEDDAVMPHRRRAWASWNYHLDDGDHPGASVTYWMNRLQRLAGPRQYFVTLNRSAAVRPERILRRLEYAHPVFTAEGVAAQGRHLELLGHRRTSYCGAYWRNGFHEDGVSSALAACRGFEVTL